MEHARDYDAYARRKRNVFSSLDLNVSNDKLFLMSIGIVFHSFGAATEKAWVARTVRVRGTARNLSADDLSSLGCWYSTSRLSKYSGWWWILVLYTMVASLKLILWATGSQCKSIKVGVILSYFLFPDTTLARAFCTVWSFFKFPAEVPYRMLLQ